MNELRRQSSEPTENTVSVDTASPLYVAHASRILSQIVTKNSKLTNTNMTIQQPSHMPSESTTALRKYHRVFWVSQYFQKSCFPTMAYCIFCDMSQFTTPPPQKKDGQSAAL